MQAGGITRGAETEITVSTPTEAMTAVASTTLRTLRLAGNFFDLQELQEFGKRVKAHPALTKLEWRDRSLMGRSGEAICAMLYKHPSIREVSFIDCDSGPSGDLNGFKSLSWLENQALQKVTIQNCQISQIERDRLKRYADTNPDKVHHLLKAKYVQIDPNRWLSAPHSF